MTPDAITIRERIEDRREHQADIPPTVIHRFAPSVGADDTICDVCGHGREGNRAHLEIDEILDRLRFEVLSEGQASAVLGVDRVDVRVLAEEYVDRCSP